VLVGWTIVKMWQTQIKEGIPGLSVSTKIYKFLLLTDSTYFFPTILFIID